MFGPAVDDAARAHALRAWPHEACGIVVGGSYQPVENTAENPTQEFRMPADTMAAFDVQAVMHSHCAPEHGPWPSASDISGQIDTGVPWAIVWCDGETARPPLWIGDHLLDAPLLERPFRPGAFDCYALVRAWYWQERGIKLPDVPRDDQWWLDGGDLLDEGFGPVGFSVADGMRAGDVILMKIRSPVPNHCAVALDHGLMLHHLANRISAREPWGRYQSMITKVVRYDG